MTTMKKIIWKFRYAKHLRKRLGITWRMSLNSADAALEDLYDDWWDHSPIEAADEEYYRWAADAL